MKRVLVLFGILICMLSFVACDKATGSEAPVTSGILKMAPGTQKGLPNVPMIANL